MRTIYNIGCKLNQYEGYCLLEKYSDIENLVVVNTCCVTKEAETKSLRKLRFALKKYPQSTVIATGCACRLSRRKFSQAHKIIDNVERNRLIRGIYPHPDRSRYFLKIQDGCNETCTFCIVPKVRDTVVSKPIEIVKDEVCWARHCGYHEIVLVGANIGLYGIDIGTRLHDLLKALSTVRDLPRIRLSSIEPKFVDAELIACLKNLPFCRHFHIPLQSADNKILDCMNRGYTVDHLQNIIELIQDQFDECAIGGDIIVGFPGEGEKEFQSTYRFVETNPFTHLHIFPYSERPGTVACTLGDEVSREEKRRRLWRLKRLIQQKSYTFRKHLCGKTLHIIAEQQEGFVSGMTDNYIRVDIDSDCTERELCAVTVTRATPEKTYGTRVST